MISFPCSTYLLIVIAVQLHVFSHFYGSNILERRSRSGLGQ